MGSGDSDSLNDEVAASKATTSEGSPDGRIEKVGNFFEKLIAVLGIVLCSAAVVLLVVAIRSGAGFAPLGPYPDQTVNAQFEVGGLPAFTEGDVVPVTGEKCADAVVEVIGSVQWQTIDPAGTFIEAGEGTRTTILGCETKTFANSMPPGVVEANREIRSSGVDAPTWVVTGVETPINPENGENGERQTWTTEPFVIVDARP